MDNNQSGFQGNNPQQYAQQPNQAYQQNPQYQQMNNQQFNGGNFQQPVQQPKQKKPIYKRWWFWVIIVIVILGIAGGAGSSDDKSDTTTTSSVSEETKENETTEKTTKNETTTKKESKKEYKDSCEKIPYKSLAREPDKYKGKRVKFTGEVVQVIESSWGSGVEYRISVTKEEYGYSADDIVYVTYTLAEGESRILEDDIVTFYGEFDGLQSYQSTLGGQITIPKVAAQYIELKN